MAKILTGRCPNCNSKLEYSSDEQVVVCYACDNSVAVSQLSSGMTAGAHSGMVAPVAMLGFDNPESGVVFIEHFFENYDWSDYQDSTEIRLFEISEVIENNKIKNGADAHSWYLAFKGLAVPLLKKIEGLKAKAERMGKDYNAEDNSESFSAFDVYRRVIDALIEKKEAIVKELESALRYAIKFNLASNMRAEIQGDLEVIKAQLSSLHPVKDISEVPEYVSAQRERDAIKANELLNQKGIDAGAQYEEAIAKFNEGGAAKREALAIFESLRGYADSTRYIEKINHYYRYFDGEMFYFGDRYYLFKREAYSTPALNISSLGKGNNAKGGDKKANKKGAGCASKGNKASAPAQAEQPAVATTVQKIALYEVVGNKRADAPILKGIDQVITYYNNTLYYFAHGKGICKFDLLTKAESTVDTGKAADYKTGGAYQVQSVLNDTCVIVKKKLQPKKIEEKKGCLSSFKKAGPAKLENLINNYQLIKINLMDGSKQVLVDQLVDVALSYDKEIFYIKAENIAKAAPAKKSFLSIFKKSAPADNGPSYKTQLMVCDLASGACKKILNEDCDIHTVHEGKVVYSTWLPNALNQDLYTYDIATGEQTLIENNVYSFFGVIGGKIYYTIGNSAFRPLVRANFDGSERREIMRNVENVLAAKGNWLYLSKGTGRNRAIVKMNVETNKRLVLCTQVKEVLEDTSTHIHYVDWDNNLRVVRTDGKENKLIAENFEKFFIMGKESIYYARTEAVANGVTGMSLYKMDHDGNNSRKLVFNIESVGDYDEDTLYYKTIESIRFKVTVPTGKNASEEHYENRKITRYFAFDKASEVSKEVLVIGWPSSSTSYKAGCLKKEVKADVKYEAVPAKCQFKYKGLASVGAVTKEANAEEAKKFNTPASPAPTAGGNKAPANAGCANGGCANGGCLSIFTSIKNFFANLFKKKN